MMSFNSVRIKVYITMPTDTEAINLKKGVFIPHQPRGKSIVVTTVKIESNVVVQRLKLRGNISLHII